MLRRNRTVGRKFTISGANAAWATQCTVIALFILLCAIFGSVPKLHQQTYVRTFFVSPSFIAPIDTGPYLGRALTSTRLNQMLDQLQLVAYTAAFFGIAVIVYARLTRRKYIQFDDLGLIISESAHAFHGERRFIAWQCVAEMRFEDGKLSIKDDDRKRIATIGWQDLLCCVEPGSFINAAKTWAPESAKQCRFPGEDVKVEAGSYTQLWFKYYSTGSERKRTSQLAPGDELQDGRYKVVGTVGGGGQGTAYLAVDTRAASGKPAEVVLKEYILPVHRGMQVLESTIDKLEKEAAILRSLTHTNIVQMRESFCEDHRGYLVMEYVQGRSLKEVVQQEGAQLEDAVRAIAAQICDVLIYLHEQTPPVVHRDITPDNLILQADGQVKLVDFNVAHQLESAATATVVGKHAYIPPEQFRGKPTPQSDIYALGCTLYYLLTAEEPEPLRSSHPRQRNSSVSCDLDGIVAKATAVDASKRFATASDLHAAIAPSAVIDTKQSVRLSSG